MGIKDFIASKLGQLQAMEREKDILVAGINKYMDMGTRQNITVGHIITFGGIQYEVIDFTPPNTWYHKDISEMRYKVLCLRLVNGSKDNSDFAKRIRKDKKWDEWDYGDKRQEKLKNYYKKNTIILSNNFYTKFE